MENNLIDRVLEQIQEDIQNGDLTAIAELLSYVDPSTLKSYLPEENPTLPLEY